MVSKFKFSLWRRIGCNCNTSSTLHKQYCEKLGTFDPKEVSSAGAGRSWNWLMYKLLIMMMMMTTMMQWWRRRWWWHEDSKMRSYIRSATVLTTFTRLRLGLLEVHFLGGQILISEYESRRLSQVWQIQKSNPGWIFRSNPYPEFWDSPSEEILSF